MQRTKITDKTQNIRTVFEHNNQRYPYLEIDDEVSKRVASIQSILSELKEIEKWLALLIDNENHDLLQFISKSLIISYGRLFNKGKRKYQINQNDIKAKLSKSELEKHEYIIKMRNNYIAHADISDREEFKSFLIVSPVNWPMGIENTYHQRTYNIWLLRENYEERLNIVIILKEQIEKDFEKTTEKILAIYQKKDIRELYIRSALEGNLLQEGELNNWFSRFFSRIKNFFRLKFFWP